MIKSLTQLLAILIISACSNQIIQIETSDQLVPGNSAKILKSEKEKWQQWANKYDTERRSKTGWLSLSGLYWLNEGNNSIGSDPSNDHKLPQEMLKHFGRIHVANDMVTFTGNSDEILINNKKIKTQILETNKTNVSYRKFSFYIIEREKRFAIRLQDNESSRVASFAGTEFYPYSKQAAIPAQLIKNKTPKTLRISTVYGTVREADSAGILEFNYKGATFQLEAVSYGADTPLNLMFVDNTGQETTYGAGRYLDVGWPKEGDDMTIINFNYAYNPPCAITEFATCPLPPRQNRLDVAIEAGELFNGH